MTTDNRTLAALGLADVPLLEPLTYPGPPVPGPSLLDADRLIPLGVEQDRLGAWSVDGRALDEVLADGGHAPTGSRYPVVAVGSNASPAQVAYKLERLGLPSAVPMVPVAVRGIAIGYGGFVCSAGYVPAAPYADDSVETTLVVTWLDAEQLQAVDTSEFPSYGRATLPGEHFAMSMPSGERLGAAGLYFSRRGILADPATGRPLQLGDQSRLLTAMLAGSQRLRGLLGPDPATFVGDGREYELLRRQGTDVLQALGWVRQHQDFHWFGDPSALRRYGELPSYGLPTASGTPGQAAVAGRPPAGRNPSRHADCGR